MQSEPACRNLVLDAGPLLSLSPLRGLADCYLTVPQVLSELKDKNAREHFEKLGLSAGVKIEVREPDAASLSQVIMFAKKTGDYTVLSHADICVLALTLALDTQDKSKLRTEKDESTGLENSAGCSSNASDVQESTAECAQGDPESEPVDLTHEFSDSSPSNNGLVNNSEEAGPLVGSGEGREELEKGDDSRRQSDAENSRRSSDAEEPLDVVLEPVSSIHNPSNPQDDESPLDRALKFTQNTPIFEDPSDEDDGEGGWITPANIDMHKSRALDLLPSADTTDPFTTVSSKPGKWKGRKSQNTVSDVNAQPKGQITVGCMTADFAMQNVLLQMGLNLVGIEGKRIEKVKTWVLRCHACYKICKDAAKKFCPSCGNPTLLRTSVTAKAPTADDSTPALQVHLKKNFVYRTRGTIFSIPAPKPGSSKRGSGDGLILREDQGEYMRAKLREDGRREREEKKILQRSLEAVRGGKSTGVKIGSWMDPDWVPDMLSVGIGGQGRRAPDGRTPLGPDGMPIVGYGRKNPNERRRKK
ncbi:hypothetical protein M0805_005377 [Coniferiporia weirii]|nr:hypothetical protein M0805_005377 [Coniferiporia weirii]